MPLTPEQIGKLVAVMTGCLADDGHDLEHLLYTKLGIRMYVTLVGRGLPFAATVLKVVQGLEAQGVTPLFLDALLKAFPTRAEVQKDLSLLLDSVGWPSADQADAVRQGVEAVSTSMVMAGVRALVITARPLLQPLADQMRLLYSYKSLHDSLHTLQAHQRRFTTAVRDFIQDVEAAGDLQECIVEMQKREAEVSNAITSLPTEPPAVRRPELEWLSQLAEARRLAEEGADKMDLITAKQSVNKVKMVLRTQPSRIDGLLMATTGELKLDALQDLFRNLAAQANGSAPAWQERQGSTALLSSQIRALVNEHNDWQSIDKEIWGAGELIPTTPDNDGSDFAATWLTVSGLVAKLARMEPETVWSKDLTTRLAALETSRVNRNWTVLRPGFETFRTKAHLQFYVIDSTLKKLCGQVADIGNFLQVNIINQL